jgi:hypothetical protein
MAHMISGSILNVPDRTFLYRMTTFPRTSTSIMATPAFPQTFQPITLPVELIHALNQTYFLHLLANEPDKVIPPGKSLLSMLAHSHVAFQGSNESDAENDTLRESIRQVAQRAFWDEVCPRI